jgi:hypothetical protein
MSTPTLVESTSMLEKLKPCFGMSSLSWISSILVVGEKLIILSFSTGQNLGGAGMTLTFVMVYTLPSRINGLNFAA